MRVEADDTGPGRAGAGDGQYARVQCPRWMSQPPAVTQRAFLFQGQVDRGSTDVDPWAIRRGGR